MMRGRDPEAEALRRRAIDLLEAGELDRARALLESVELESRDLPAFWLLLADIDQRQGHHEAAAVSFAEAVRLDPDNDWYSRYLFHSYWRRARLGELEAVDLALEELERYLSRFDSPWHERMRANVLWLMDHGGPGSSLN